MYAWSICIYFFLLPLYILSPPHPLFIFSPFFSFFHYVPSLLRKAYPSSMFSSEAFRVSYIRFSSYLCLSFCFSSLLSLLLSHLLSSFCFFFFQCLSMRVSPFSCSLDSLSVLLCFRGKVSASNGSI